MELMHGIKLSDTHVQSCEIHVQAQQRSDYIYTQTVQVKKAPALMVKSNSRYIMLTGNPTNKTFFSLQLNTCIFFKNYGCHWYKSVSRNNSFYLLYFHMYHVLKRCNFISAEMRLSSVTSLGKIITKQIVSTSKRDI